MLRVIFVILIYASYMLWNEICDDDEKNILYGVFLYFYKGTKSFLCTQLLYAFAIQTLGKFYLPLCNEPFFLIIHEAREINWLIFDDVTNDWREILRENSERFSMDSF